MRGIVVVGIVLAAGVAAAADSPSPSPSPTAGASEKKMCEAYAVQAQTFARGRDGGVTLESHLAMAAAACAKRPTSRSACKDFPTLAREVHEGKWSPEEAAKKVRADCARYVSRDPLPSPSPAASPRPVASAARR